MTGRGRRLVPEPLQPRRIRPGPERASWQRRPGECERRAASQHNRPHAGNRRPLREDRPGSGENHRETRRHGLAQQSVLERMKDQQHEHESEAEHDEKAEPPVPRRTLDRVPNA